MKKKQLTFEEHKQLGATLHWMRENFLRARTVIGNGLGTSSKPSRQSARILAAIDELRSELEEVVYRDFPDRHREEKLSCYYPLKDDYETARIPRTS